MFLDDGSTTDDGRFVCFVSRRMEKLKPSESLKLTLRDPGMKMQVKVAADRMLKWRKLTVEAMIVVREPKTEVMLRTQTQIKSVEL